jgi:hypothetical protein
MLVKTAFAFAGPFVLDPYQSRDQLDVVADLFDNEGTDRSAAK